MSTSFPLLATLMATFLVTAVDCDRFLGQTPFRAYASRSAAPGTILYQFFAQDNGLTNYTLVSGGYLFTLDESTGVLKTKTYFPRSGPSWYELEVRAIDAGKQQLTSTINVTITPEWVLAPVLEQNSYSATVTENAALQNNLYVIPTATGTRITVVRGFPLRPAQITSPQYLIVAGNRDDDLMIDSFGVLSSGKALDRERTSAYHLVVRYTDGIAAISASVNITVADVNDNFPAFSQDLFSFSVSENSAAGSTIAILNAVDPDAGENGTVTYSIGDFNNCSYVTLAPASGALVIISQPNYERWPTCTLVVIANDGGTPPLSAKAIVSVALSNVDDECPKFVNSEYSVEICWNSTRPPSSAISLVFIRAFDPDNFTAGIVYSLESKSVLFDVNASSGELVLLPTTGDPTGVYALTMSAKDLTCQSYVLVIVVISSPNLHSPRFAQRTVQVNMTENPPQGTIVAILNAIDADAGSNGAIVFSLASPSALFAVNYSTGVVYTIGVPSMYDSEMGPPTLTFVVLATDGGGKIGDCLLQVTLINQNDNAPTFPVSRYNISVLRNTGSGVTVLQVIASDPDPGSGGLVHYLLSSSSQPFSIGVTSGNITTTGSVSGNSYLLVVTAQDQAPPFNNGTILVSIMTSTMQPPVWPRTFYQASITEFAPTGTSVLTAAVNTLQPTYSTSGINYRSNQSPSTFSINLNGVISVGTTSIVSHQMLRPFSDFLFVVSVVDTCGPSVLCNSLTTVRIAVSKTNNYPLQFSQEEAYTAAVLEGQDVGTFVAFIQATDIDFNPANYTLSGSDKFSISTEGILRSAAIFNATDGPYLFRVIASYLTQTATAYIQVTVVPTNAPQFNDSSPVLLLLENTQVGSSVFSAVDYSLDNDPAAVLTFSIMGPNQNTFIMNANGTLLLAQRLDYEQQSAYNLTIQVFDGKHTAHTTLSVIIVKVPPTIFLSKIQWGELVENCPAGTFAVTMNYSMVPIAYQLLGKAQGRFAVSPGGIVTVAGDIDRESLLPNAQAIFQAVVQSNTTLYTTNVTINVLDVNDCYPNFQHDYAVRIQENTVPAHNGSYVTQVRAVDLDAGNNASVTYTYAILSGTESGFSIDPITGVIITHFEYDREQTPEYILLVQARDSGTPMQLSSTALVLVEIGDVNDNAPTFPCSPMYARVLENTPIGTTIFTFVAIDHDKGPNGTVTFGIVSDNSSGLFVMDTSMQGLKLTAPLDYAAESNHMFMFTVSLHDNGVPALTGTPGILIVEVLKTNTIAPSIICTVLENFNYTINENTPTQTTVATVAASSSSAVYAITRGNERGDFTLSIQQAGSAFVQIAKELSYTLAPSYQLTIVANDDSNPPLSSSCILLLTIGNVYNLVPLFGQTIYDGSVYENSGPTTRILVISAIARSSGYITGYYIISADSANFILNSTTGELGTNASFNRDIQSRYFLTVSAVDSFSLSTTVKVVINVDPSPKDGVIQIQLMILDSLTPTHELGTIKLGASDNVICTNCVITTENVSLFSVNRSTCVLSVLQPDPPPGVYTLKIQGNCGNAAYTNSTVAINVSNVFSSKIPLMETVVLSLHTTASLFLSYGGWTDFPIAMAAVLSADNITLLSIQDSTNDPSTADVAFYAQNQSGYLSQTRILQDIFVKRDMLASLGYRVWNLPSDPCANSPCLNLASCISFKNITHIPNIVTSRWQILSTPQVELGYQCSCLVGSAGTLCEINFDDCYSNPCQGQATCVDGLQDFTCICPPWSTGETCSVLINDCQPGYYGKQCQYQYFVETSYCTPNPCQNGATCSSGRDSFTCYCPVGFTGEYCNKTVTYQGGCVQNPCLHGSTCQQDSSFSPTCTCSAGFTGPTCCWPLDSCELQPCKNGGTCMSGLYGSYLCICTPGYRGVNCTEPVPACDSTPCMNGGWCSEAVNGSFTCVCPQQFYGPMCENPVMPEDLCASSACPAHNSMCTFGRTGYTCSCPRGLLAPNCTSPAHLPCDSAPCLHGGSCINNSNGYVCNCSQGFGGDQCRTAISYCVSSPCQNGGTCFDGIGAYSCRCKTGISGPTCGVYCPSGYTGDHCDEKILQCTSNPCLNGGSCTEGAVQPTCTCPPDFTGPWCETDCGGPGTTCNLAVSFGGSRNLSSYRTCAPLAFNSQGRVSLEFATTDLNGLLMYSAQYLGGSLGDYFAVEVEGGYLKVSVSLVGGAPTVLKSFSQVNDGLWHEMDFSISNKVDTLFHFALTGTLSECFASMCECVYVYTLNLSPSLLHPTLTLPHPIPTLPSPAPSPSLPHPIPTLPSPAPSPSLPHPIPTLPSPASSPSLEPHPILIQRSSLFCWTTAIFWTTRCFHTHPVPVKPQSSAAKGTSSPGLPTEHVS